MSRATIQAMCLLGACQSGLITTAKAYPNLSEDFKDMLIMAHNLISDAVGAWTSHKVKDKRVDAPLAEWHQRMKGEGYGDVDNMTVMVSLSKQAIDELIDKVRDKDKLALLDPVVEILDDMNGILQSGGEDHLIVPQIEKAEEMLYLLFDVCGFEPYA